MISWEKPLLKKIEETAAEHASSLNDSEREQVCCFKGILFYRKKFRAVYKRILGILNTNHRKPFQIQNLLDAVHPSSSGSQEITTTLDEYPERPPSVVLEAVTLRQQAFDASTCATSSTLALEVPTILKVCRLLSVKV